MASDAPLSASNAGNGQAPLLAPHANAGGAAKPDAGDAALDAVFDRVRRDLSFISRHHPHLRMSGDELSVLAKAIARQLTAQPLMGSDKKDVMH